ncbi:MAG TPA: nitrile hydratase subunit beta [Chloroflexota bacterium]|nr:nitrile hydratase subunit beta [Chloroflexota bacterium]
MEISLNGIHDLGGMQGFGPVHPEPKEPVFHSRWEGVVFAMQQAVRRRGIYNVDESRYGIERMDPAHYLASSYYEKWLESLVTNLVEKGIITTDEVTARTALLAAKPENIQAAPRPSPKANATVLEPDDSNPARFKVGDRVIARNVHPTGHNRIPRYVRGKRGVVDRIWGAETYPDTNALGLGKHPQNVYSVRFEGVELWGDSAEAGQSLYIDLWDSYLDPA